MFKVLIACVWLLVSTVGAMAHATSVVFLNPGTSTETFWVSYAQFMQAAAKDLGLDLRVRYSERDTNNTLVQAREALQGSERPDYLVLVNEQYVAPQILRMAEGSGVKLLVVNSALTADQMQLLGSRSGIQLIGSLVADDEQAGYLMLSDLLRQHGPVAPGQSLDLLAFSGSKTTPVAQLRERGMDIPDHISDADVWLLIFAPGFSTAEVVTDVSGRGVGLDVVKRNIAALNGTVEVESTEGVGTKVSVRLPLTLAIMDGMSVGVGDEVYILPLSSVVESFQVNSDAVSTVAQGAQLVKVRDEYMPVIALEKIFQVPRVDPEKGSTIMVVVEADGSRVALLVDELLGQHQVVVKNLESNYRKVPNVSGATILGDGRVALILDTGGLVRRARH